MRITQRCPECDNPLDNVWDKGILYHKCSSCNYEVRNEFSVAVLLWEKYLNIVQMIESVHDIAFISCFDSQRSDTHKALLDFYGTQKKEKLDYYCHNLNSELDLSDDNIDYNAQILARVMMRR